MDAAVAFTIKKDGQTGLQLAAAEGIKDAIAVRFQDKLYDLTHLWPSGAQVSFLKRQDPEALDFLRHDAAHLTAQALTELYPDIQLAIGPATQDGFYYDLLNPTPLGEEDLQKIEDHMHTLVDRDDVLTRDEWERDKALAFFKKHDEPFKVEIIQDLPKDEILSVYTQGKFTDLCRGPHLPSTGLLGHGFKLLKLAGAYWRGDHKRPMLQRVYGTYFPSEKQLRVYLNQLKEAEKRDHRKVGKALELFHFQEEARGDIFWHPKGHTILRTLQSYIRQKLEKSGYQEILTPQVLSRSLWEKSGHWEKFRDAMISCDLPDSQEGKEPLALKPMNCPGHVQVFKNKLRSYRDLPLRFAEFGCCKRFEPSGALFGLMRLRAFTQDDGHIFCTPDMIASETKAFCDLLRSVYKDLGFTDVKVLFSDRPKVRAGDDATWDASEKALRDGALAAGLEFGENPGEGAFYGPKLEFILKDALGRSWQCGTWQVDYILPQRLGATYIGPDGNKHTPAMLHRAILGSFERFIGILIENYAGALPFWLAPLQLVLMPVTNAQEADVQKTASLFRDAGVRVFCDSRPDKIHGKIREWSLQKVPYIGVMGDKEVSDQTLSLRTFGKNYAETMDLTEAIQQLASKARMPHDSSIASAS